MIDFSRAGVDKDFTVAIGRGYHAVTAYDMSRDLRERIGRLPKRAFAELEVGDVVFKAQAYEGGGTDVFKVLKVTPQRKQIEAVRPGPDSRPFRAYAGGYHAPLTVFDEEMISLIGVTHREIVTEAVRLRLEVPREVRVCYPEMFVKIPERFSAERVAETLKPSWGKVVTAATVKAFREERHQRIRQMEENLSKAVVLNPDVAVEYERLIAGCLFDIDFFTWLLRHVSAGGALHAPGDDVVEGGPHASAGVLAPGAAGDTAQRSLFS
ncbi:MAG: hypothetical protein ACJ74Q_15185 [Pyrinomonadaceae bacterium]